MCSGDSCRCQKHVSNIIDNFLEWSPKLALSGMMEKQQIIVNATESNSSFTDVANSGPDVDAGGQSTVEQHGEEAENVEDAIQFPQHDYNI